VLRRLTGLSLVLGLLVAAPLAQTGSGSIRGVIRDAAGAVIPGADVTLTNVATNVKRSTVSNEVGLYVFTGLPRGQYELSVQMPGFKTWTAQVEVTVGQTVGLDVQLELGEISTTVEVVGATPIITTESMEVADVKDRLRIEQLPLNGRAVANLFDLTPGVDGGANARVVGMKVGSLDISLDGVPLVDRFGGGMVRVQPGLDTVQEFRIETSGSDARYSRPATAILATRSGTNEFHGSIFETHRNNGASLRARRREETGDAAKLIRNEFGASAGGPLWLGGLYDGRDKTFWFFSYEGLRQRQEVLSVDVVPSDAMWAGDFSNLVDASGKLTVIYDPLTTDANGQRLPFPNNIIPQDRISPYAKVLQEVTHPATNDINPLQGNNLVTIYPRWQDNDTTTLRVDQVLSEKDNLSVRWTRNVLEYAQEGGRYGYPAKGLKDAFGSGRQDTEINNVAVNYVRAFSPSLINELLVGVNRNFNSSGTLADFTDWSTKLGFPNPFGATGWPTLGAWIYWDSDNRKDQALTAVKLDNNTTWIRGDHTFEFGGRLQREHNNVRELQQAQGSHNFHGGWTSLYDPVGDQGAPYTGFGMAELLLGLPGYLSNQYNRGYFYFRQWEMALYAQDTWRVHPRVTLRLGVRWDKWTPYQEEQNRLTAIDTNTVFERFEVITPAGHPMESLPGIPASVLASWANRGLTWVTADQVPGYPGNLFQADNNNFGPRLGVSVRIANKTVLRGSYGEYFWTMPLSQMLQSMRINPPLNLRFTNQPNMKDDSGTWVLRNAPGPQDYLGAIGIDTEGIVRLPANAQGGLMFDGRNWKESHARTWNVTLEHELFKDTSLRLSYIGTQGRDLEQRASINSQEHEYNYVARTGEAPIGNRDQLLRRNPDWALNFLNRTGYSNTHSGQIEIEKKYSDGMAFQWFYVFTRSLTTSDAGGFESGDANINATNGVYQVPENHQIMGNPDLSYEERLRMVYFNSVNIPPHQIKFNGIINLPFGRGARWGKDVAPWVNQIIGGWQVAWIGAWRSGLWSSVDPSRYMFGYPVLNSDQRLEMDIFGRHQRLWFAGDFDPTLATNVSGGDLMTIVSPDCTQRVVRQLGPKCNNQLPQVLKDGTVRMTSVGGLFNTDPRAFFRGPGSWNVDFSIFKHFFITEEVNLRFTADFFNVFNHPVDVAPNAVTGLQDLSRQANEPRTIQFSLRLAW